MKLSRHRTATASIALALAFATILLPSVSGRAASPVFSDNFETGNLAKWSQVSGVVAQQTVVFNGSWAGRANVAGTAGYAYESLAPALSDVYLDARVNLRSASTSVNIMRLRTSTGSGLVSVKVNAKNKLVVKNDVTGVITTSATTFTKGVWHELQLHALVSGTSSTIEVWLDGSRVNDISGTVSLGTTPVGRAQIGSNSSTTMDVVFDDVIVDTVFVGGAGDTTAPTVPQNLHTTAVAGNHVDLAWDASSDAVGVTGYTIYRDGSPIGTTPDGSTTTFSDTTVAPSSNYSYTVDAFDAATNHSAQSSPPLAVSTPALDTTKPSKPTGLTATAIGSNRVDLTWSASTDNVAVTGYTIYRNAAQIGTTPDGSTTTFSDTTAASGTTYAYTVDAFDAAGNHSDLSDPASATTGVGDPVIGVAGDIACDPADVDFNGGNGIANHCGQKRTSDLLLGAGLTAVLPLGDEQYECGGGTAFTQSYDPSWGRVKSITYPVPGNHEYDSSGGTNCDTTGHGAGYFNYFGTSFPNVSGHPEKGYYSYNLGAWHIVALNSECSHTDGCLAGSVQERWLASDLAANGSACTLAYWHKPRFASSNNGGSADYGAFWNDLYADGAEIVLNGHVHIYERFAPQTPSQVASANGIREFIVGTGGKSTGGLSTTAPNSQVRQKGTFGVLKLSLHPSSYDWQFLAEPGDPFTDSGSGTCH
jgi:acid phosphatase type 7